MIEKLFVYMRALKFSLGSEIVNIRNCKNPLGFSFDTGGFHFLIEALSIYDNDGYESAEAYMKMFYEKFTPSTSEFLLTTLGMKVRWNIEDPFQYPWGNFSFNEDVIYKKDTINARICGPNNIEKTKRNFKQFIELYESIRQYGVRNPIITGAFLLKNSQSRFIVLQGNHRLAILAKLGVKQVRVKKLSSDKNIKYEHLQSYKYVREGQCDLKDSQRYFDALFDSSGLNIKEYYAL